MTPDPDQIVLDGTSSPLDFAADRQSRLTMSTVRGAVERGDAVLAFQPIVPSDRPTRPAFYEGLIRIIDETGRFVPGEYVVGLLAEAFLARQSAGGVA